jgi:hypothetical protein
MATRRPRYVEAVEWIALNDAPGDVRQMLRRASE